MDHSKSPPLSLPSCWYAPWNLDVLQESTIKSLLLSVVTVWGWGFTHMTSCSSPGTFGFSAITMRSPIASQHGPAAGWKRFGQFLDSSVAIHHPFLTSTTSLGFQNGAFL
ncbi:hypothetical protein P175DRAFT_0531741 [Aspergillus ochraceoroseus IBT 24754]|uniref:Uncharacterized protein n=1 Tax=Aspergillus ochraceoroseus IBT 24754 TaxID=1392256 RepID=A0A2T5M0Y4_9EURO|nr:uncharacterized protein P175DRAFT_0531741 [Aspergillus ochraceoroseus IBT 24754]PTU22191.1 hypothetical protein P175DRAFT_0531741 [Aspergillus ochraceoroseus IBT 24754]